MFPNTKQWLAASCAVSLVAVAAHVLPGTKDASIVAAAVPDAQAKATAVHHYAASPMAFERNEGQTDASVAYLSRGLGYSLFLTPGEAVFAVQPKRQAPDPEQTTAQGEPAQAEGQAVIRMSLAGANPHPVIEGRDRQAGVSHYLQGRNPAQWRGSVTRYGKVQYQDVYPGIDLLYYGNQRELEYDFVVAPGRDPGQIAVSFSGPESLRLDTAGNLVLKTAIGDMVQHKPVVYQEVAGQRRPVDGSYRLLADNRVGFSIGRYDTALPLVIDPVFTFTSYLGGSGGDAVVALATDKDANLYALGCTSSVNFPVTRPMDSTYAAGGECDVFITKYNADLNGIVYSTYLGGTGDDAALAIATDADRNVIVVGHTDSADFPTTAALQPALRGPRDGFVLKLDPTGSHLVYSTYLGGSDADWAFALAVDAAGRAYVGGATLSSDFPTKASVSGNTYLGAQDGFLTRINASGSLIEMSRYIGGSGYENVYGIDVDANANAYVTGMTDSFDFPVVSAVGGAIGGSDAFATRVAPNGTVTFSTYLGGSRGDIGRDIAVDDRGRIAVVGKTSGVNFGTLFPTDGLYLPQQDLPGGGDTDGFVAMLDPSLVGAPYGSLLFGTYFGGSGEDDLREVEFDSHSGIYAVGYTTSPGLVRQANGMQEIAGGGYDAFVTRYWFGQQVWSTYLGGSGDDYGYAIALYGVGNIFVAGSTESGNLSTYSPLQPASGGGHDGFVSRLGYRSYWTITHDFNADVAGDILWRNAGNGQNVIWRSATPSQQAVAKASTSMQVAAVADFDCDFVDDILWRDASTGSNAIWLSANSATQKAVTAVTNPAWYVAAAADFNDDCKADILWRNSTTGVNTIWWSGDYATQQGITRVSNLDWKVVGVGDFNGDYGYDLLWRNNVTGANAIWLNGSYGTQQAIRTVNTEWTVAGIGDFLGDGRSDILWHKASTGENVIWRQGDYRDQQPVSRVKPGWSVAAVADYNSDGRSDILWRNAGTGQNVIWRSGSSANPQAVATVSTAWTAIR